METKSYVFSGKQVPYYLGESLRNLEKYADPGRTILIVDDQVQSFHADKLKNWRKVIVRGEEASKDLRIFEQVVNGLIGYEVDRKTLLVGIGGGVVTDLTGFVGSIYMRGIPYAFVPTTLLSQVDAAIGGKNGVNYGQYKNMLGVIRQPEFILFDDELLQTLSDEQWHNGFAEIIKSACICDRTLFDFLKTHLQTALSHDREVIAELVRRTADIKSVIVQEDEFEKGQRRLLNFGHTVGHAVEKLEGIAHGQAVAKGMAVAAAFSRQLTGLPAEEAGEVIGLIRDYHLPVQIHSDPDAIARLFRMDKKREDAVLHFILLEKIGRAVIRPIGLEDLKAMLEQAMS